MPVLFDWTQICVFPLQWRHNGSDGVSNHRRIYWLFNRLFRHISKKTSKFRVTGLCEGNSPVTGEFPAQRASNAENVSIWWRHQSSWLRGIYPSLQLSTILQPLGAVRRFGNHWFPYRWRVRTITHSASWLQNHIGNLCCVTQDSSPLLSNQSNLINESPKYRVWFPTGSPVTHNYLRPRDA